MKSRAPTIISKLHIAQTPLCCAHEMRVTPGRLCLQPEERLFVTHGAALRSTSFYLLKRTWPQINKFPSAAARAAPSPLPPPLRLRRIARLRLQAERRSSTDIKNYKLCLFIQRHSAPVPGWSAWCLRLVKIFPWMALLLKPDVSHSPSRKYRSVEGFFFLSLCLPLLLSVHLLALAFPPFALKCCKRKKNCQGLKWANRLLETDVNESDTVSYCFG